VYTLSITNLHDSSLVGAVLSRLLVLFEFILCFTRQTGQKEGKIKTEKNQRGKSIKCDNANECHHCSGRRNQNAGSLATKAEKNLFGDFGGVPHPIKRACTVSDVIYQHFLSLCKSEENGVHVWIDRI